MNYFKYLHEVFERIIEDLVEAGALPTGLDCGRVVFEPPRDPAHGDVATNAAMVLAKAAGRPPRAVAEILAPALTALAVVAEAEIAGPGFINLRLIPGFWHARLAEIVRAGASYGRSKLGAGRRINVEYVSANPTGPLHAAHARGAVVGDVLAALLETVGYDVTREYYINDAGGQVVSLAWATYWRYLQALGRDETAAQFAARTPTGTLEYRGEYLVPVGRALAERVGDSLADQAPEAWLPTVRDFAIDAMMALIRDDLAALGVSIDVFTSERALVESGRVEAALAVLDAAGHIYTGVLEPPKGRKSEDWEPRPQTLFRATAFGDDVDRPLRKSDGSWTYFASDIAYHLDKFRRGGETMIDVWGADHGGYVKRMTAAVKAVTGGAGALDVKICQLVTLMENGRPVKMSKRAGTFVTLCDVVDQVGKDVVRFIMLTRRNDAALDFDFAKVTEDSRDNPVWYVQYTHARTRSVMRQARAQMPNFDIDDAALADAPLARLTDPAELALIRVLAGWPALIEGAAKAHEPHRLAFYLGEVAGAFNALWTRGAKIDQGLRFLVAEDESLTGARLALVHATGVVVAAGLRIFGVTPVEELR